MAEDQRKFASTTLRIGLYITVYTYTIMYRAIRKMVETKFLVLNTLLLTDIRFRGNHHLCTISIIYHYKDTLTCDKTNIKYLYIIHTLYKVYVLNHSTVKHMIFVLKNIYIYNYVSIHKHINIRVSLPVQSLFWQGIRLATNTMRSALPRLCMCNVFTFCLYSYSKLPLSKRVSEPLFFLKNQNYKSIYK